VESERRVVVQIAEAKTRSQISSAKELIIEYATSPGIDLSFDNFEREMAEFPGAYARPDGRILLAIEEGDAIGIVALRRLSGRTCEMKRLYVRHEFRGRGIGRMLAERVIEEAKEAGYSRMRLDTLFRLREAIFLYESLGFKKIGPYKVNPNKGVIYMELNFGRVGTHRTSAS
jgi:putative acetyltransferase